MASFGAATVDLAAGVLDSCAAAGFTLCVAESLTGGLVAGALTAPAGASRVFRGGVIAYSNRLKADLLGVDEAVLERVGAVDREVALQMGDGAARLTGASLALATTGVAGPDPQDGWPVGTVWIAVVGSGRDGPIRSVRALTLTGGRNAIRMASVDGALGLLKDALDEDHRGEHGR